MTRKTLGGLVNDVGFRLLRTTASGPGNTLLSPASIFMALAAIGTATRGLTQHEVAQAIGVHLDGIEAAAAALRTICSADPSLPPDQPMDGAWVQHPTVGLAMALWLRNGVPLTPSFTAANAASYHAEIATVDFADPTLPHVVNDWVRQHTRGRITHVVESFDPLSVLCLLTTLYAHGTWSTPFDHGNTQARLWPFQAA